MSKCLVCNVSMSSGPSYGAQACPSCRVFFRRQLIKPVASNGICYTGGTCEISEETRTCCQKCRYMKCLKIGMDPTRVDRRNNQTLSKSKGENQTRQIIDEALKNLVIPLVHRPFLHVTTLANFESSMPFTQEEMNFCLHLKQTKINAWQSHPTPLKIKDAILSKKVMKDPQDLILQQSNHLLTKRFVTLFNSLDLFKRYNNTCEMCDQILCTWMPLFQIRRNRSIFATDVQFTVLTFSYIGQLVST